MRPIRTTESNHTFEGFRPDIADLPGRVDVEGGKFAAVFRPTDEERAAIAAGAEIRLTIYSLPIPPVMIEAVEIEESSGEMLYDGKVLAEPDFRCSSCGALYVGHRAAELNLKCGQCSGELRLTGAAD